MIIRRSSGTRPGNWNWEVIVQCIWQNGQQRQFKREEKISAIDQSPSSRLNPGSGKDQNRPSTLLIVVLHRGANGLLDLNADELMIASESSRHLYAVCAQGRGDKRLEIIVIYMHCIEDFLKISRVSLANIEVWRTWSAMCMSLCRRGTQDAIVWTRIDQTLHLSLRLSLSINKWRIVSQMVCCWSSLEFHRSRFTALEYRISEMLSPITMKFKLSTAP